MQSFNSATKEASAYLQRGMARCMQMSAERGQLHPSKRSQHPVITATCDGDAKPLSTPSRGAAMVSASKISSAKKGASGFWEQGSSTQTSALSTVDIVDGEENFSFKLTPNFKTYGKITHNITSENCAMTKFEKASLKAAQIFSPEKNSVAQLSLNPSVTLTAISTPIASKCALSQSKNSKNSLPPKGNSLLNKSFNCSPSSENASQSLSLYNSSRKLNFESNASDKIANDDSNDSDLEIFPRAPLKVKKLSRTPFKAVKKSSLLNGISPSKIEKAYGGPSSNPEKENVPIMKEDEEIQLQSHLLGFPNLGNTCYLNAVLQSLVSMRVFRLDVKSFVQRMPPPADSLLHGLASLLDARRTGRPSSLRRPLRLLKENFEKLDSSFIGLKMQDANEFLTKVLDTIKDEVDKLLTEEVHKSKKQISALPFSPIHGNAPRLINNSVVVRSLSPGEAASAYKTIDCRRGKKRSLSSESLRQNGCGNAAKNSVDSNGDTLRLVISESEESHSDCDTSPPHPKVCKTSSTNNKRNSSKLKDVGSYSSVSHLTNLRSEAHNGCKRSPAKKQSSSNKNMPSNPKSNKNEQILNDTHESDVSANPITANFGFYLQEVYTCLGCNARVLRSQEYFSLYVHLASCEAQDSRRPRSMRAAVAEYMKQEQRELKCESCSHPTALVTTTFTKMPRILIIQMKRYTYDAAEFSSLKVCSSIEVNKHLDLSPYTGSSVSCYPSLAVDMASAPSTPVKVTPAAHRVVGGARAEVLRSNNGEPSTAGGIGANSADVADNATAAAIENESAESKQLSEDEAIQEAMRRSLEDSAVVPSCGNDDSASAIPLVNVEDEETDLMKAIRLSLLEAQERERIKAAEEEAARMSAAKAAEAEHHRAETPGVPDEEDECDGAHSYCLASIVTHYGMNTTAGHYVCDAVNEKNNLWLHYDDDCVTEVPLCEVLGPSRQRNGYIFFYVHKDLLSPASQTLSP